MIKNVYGEQSLVYILKKIVKKNTIKESKNMSKHLEGIRVIELGTHVAVPKAARIMADWGAEVIKVEPPKGEPWRTMGPAYEMPASPENNPIFQVENMNKKSVALNLKTPEGHDAMVALLKSADVFITNTRLKGLEKLGLGYEEIKKVNPKLIYVHFGAYGQQGPEKDFPGFDIAAFWAKSGALVEWTLKEDKPFKPQPGVGDGACGSIMLSSILAALIKRGRTGEGELIQTSLYSAALWYNSIGLLCGQPKYGLKFPKEIHTDPLVPPYRSKDGYWVMACSPSWSDLYPKVFKLIGLESYIGDPMLHERDAARQNYHKVCGIIADAWSKMTAEELVTAFSQNGIVCVKLLGPNDLYDDPQAWANDYLAHVTLENGDDLVVPRVPVQFGSDENAELKLAPMLGADTDAVMSELGYTKEQIDALKN